MELIAVHEWFGMTRGQFHNTIALYGIAPLLLVAMFAGIAQRCAHRRSASRAE